MLIAIILGTVSLCVALTYRVAIDGSQAYTGIQQAIADCAHGDTVLVYPGRYQENISFMGKNITLASLELTTGDLQYKYSTILDGNQNGSVVLIKNGESNVSIRGFTITNGTGTYYSNRDQSFGGGVNIALMQAPRKARITNCLITGNQATRGGGVFAGRCHLTLSGTTIKDNIAVIGGGMEVDNNYISEFTTTFDPVNRCSIYSNKAALGCDLRFYWQSQIHVVVDTFTVATPSPFYAAANPANNTITDNPYTFDILHSVHEEINSDLYVAPWGDDNNSGLTASSPLRTVFQAIYNIASDPDAPKTIHLAPGYYSESANRQFYPLPMKGSTRLSGSSQEETILDMELDTCGFLISPFTNDFVIENLSIVNCKEGISTTKSHNVLIDNVAIKNVVHITGVGFGFVGYKNTNTNITSVTIQDVYVPDNKSCYGVSLAQHSGLAGIYNTDISGLVSGSGLKAVNIHASQSGADVIIDGCRIHNNNSAAPDSWNTVFQIAPFMHENCEHLGIEISNSAFYDNHQSYSQYMAYARAVNDTTHIRNCTFAGNSGGGAALVVLERAVLENNVFWNPELENEVVVYYSTPSPNSSYIVSHVEFDNNCIRGGQDGIYNMSPNNVIIWRPNNTDADPQFAGDGNAPYRLSALSPLIDAGLRIDYGDESRDAGGNERYYDGDGDGIAQIDIGAYEYQPIYAPVNLTAKVEGKTVQLSWQIPDAERGFRGFRIYRDDEPYADINDTAQCYFQDSVAPGDTLTYYVVALYGNVESAPSNSVTVITDEVGNADELAPPLISKVLISPNPFSEIAVIHYELGKQAELEIKVYNIRGQLVRTLYKGKQGKGEQALAWEGCDDNGRYVASGVYLLQMKLDGKAQKPMKLVKVR
ncbi:MAG: FlgD immunoglobulin-like domain containing protein [Candidatus Cloacimonadaceae bacterium]